MENTLTQWLLMKLIIWLQTQHHTHFWIHDVCPIQMPVYKSVFIKLYLDRGKNPKANGLVWNLALVCKSAALQAPATQPYHDSRHMSNLFPHPHNDIPADQTHPEQFHWWIHLRTTVSDCSPTQSRTCSSGPVMCIRSELATLKPSG